MKKVIVITGLTRGLGRILAEIYASEGHTVIGCGRNAAQIKELSRRYSAPHSFTVVDVADDLAVAAWARLVLSKSSAPDLILNNAALMNKPAPLWKVTAKEFDSLMAVNLSGVANVVRHFVPAMIQRGKGVIVNFSSGWGRTTSPEVAPYCTTKWGIEGLTRSLAAELPNGLAAVSLNPGIINTEMLRECWAEGATRFPSPEVWVREAAPFLLSLDERNNGDSLSIGLTDE